MQVDELEHKNSKLLTGEYMVIYLILQPHVLAKMVSTLNWLVASHHVNILQHLK